MNRHLNRGQSNLLIWHSYPRLHSKSNLCCEIEASNKDETEKSNGSLALNIRHSFKWKGSLKMYYGFGKEMA
uniref:Uncharacterized protein n=1 Tax=Daphnia galeata TaxID=27404 RepID=A0A8J2RME4_9CRUS|nr:unnamed protein product [Daphnia galeata]